MDSVGLRTEDVRGVRWILFDRPEALNALRRADIVEARALVEEASRSLDAVAFRGVGEVSFSAGLHVEEFVDLTPELARGLISNLEAMLEVVRRVPIPTLCAVNGYCLGGAMELAMVCDVRVASENAVFGMPEIKVGIPSVLDAALLQQHVGLSKAKEMLPTGDLYGTAEMDRHGFLNKVVEPHRLDEELSAINSRLVYCSVSAFGETGPLRDEAGYEAIMQAYSGVMSVTGEPEGDPVRCCLSFIDLTTGIISAYAVLGALLHRERTGQGQKVETSLLETAVSLLSYHAEAYLLDGTVPERLGSGHPSMVPYRNFQCRDGRFIFIAASNDRLWERLCAALGLDHLLEDPRFGDVIGRVENRGELEDLVAAKVAEYDLDIIHEVLREGGVPAAPVNTVDRLMNEPQVEHRRMVLPVTHSTLGEISIIGQPMKFSAMEARKPAAPPAYGEHTGAILRELGYTDEDVSALRDKGVVR